jgi:hypothetical protein
MSRSWVLPTLLGAGAAAACGGRAIGTFDGGADAPSAEGGSNDGTAGASSSNYFYCVVEPEIVMGGLTKKPCGDDGSHGCHYSDRVPVMPLQPLSAAILCNDGVPVDTNDVAPGTAPALNLGSVRLEMAADWQTAPFYVDPTGMTGHPTIFTPEDKAIVDIIMKWASMM